MCLAMSGLERFRRVRKLFVVVGALALGCVSLLAGPAISQAAGSLPCDIYGAAGTSCVAAYSTVRALYSGYEGPLYQVRRVSDGATTDVGLLATGGYANATEQDGFCAHTTCVITKLYDQSPEHNDLTIEGPGGAAGQDAGANAAALPIVAGGHRVFGLYIAGQTGYRDNSTHGVAVNGEPEGMYMVASGTHVNSGCCFDFGNAETNTDDNGNGHMEAVNLGTKCYFGPCTGSGPWVEAIVRGEEPSRVRVSAVRFTPSARTAWHSHAVGQTLYVTEGAGLFQSRGGAIEEIRAGDVVYTPADEWHWHGAAPDHFMSHLSITEAVPGDERPETDWGQHVTDDEYHGR